MTETHPSQSLVHIFSSVNASVGGLNRLLPVDALRGFIILVMALDHANFFVARQHPSLEHWGLPIPIYENGLNFLTRFITHLAAPGFFFLMGIGMLLFSQSRSEKGWAKWRIMRHFWLRGVLLILLQLLIVNRAWELSPDWGLNIYFGVLFALGGAMILGSFLLWLKPSMLLFLTLFLFIGTELIHPDPGQWGSLNNDLANLLLVLPAGDNTLWVNYPILPWFELVVFGMFFGHWLIAGDEKAYRRGLILGIVFLLLFLLLRWLDGFGNIRPKAGDGWIDFLNVIKYPPSMTFTLLAMGLNLTLLWIFNKLSARSQFLFPLAVFGQAPLFFYILHLFLYAILGMLLFPEGSSIPIMAVYWIFGLVLLFPLTYFYGRFKAAQPSGSIAKFF
ncbi:MAG: heparan-alpha-glucosaminide N-acetyltransferase domain-containing protein [Anaerolineae bacterium]|nr:MAG: heparan-alpha-glucosaminide N-acetyltransferase domain-containing protein [Anaerolineae bacterium]